VRVRSGGWMGRGRTGASARRRWIGRESTREPLLDPDVGDGRVTYRHGPARAYPAAGTSWSPFGPACAPSTAGRVSVPAGERSSPSGVWGAGSGAEPQGWEGQGRRGERRLWPGWGPVGVRGGRSSRLPGPAGGRGGARGQVFHPSRSVSPALGRHPRDSTFSAAPPSRSVVQGAFGGPTARVRPAYSCTSARGGGVEADAAGSERRTPIPARIIDGPGAPPCLVIASACLKRFMRTAWTLRGGRR
jgi:hypothetical protein